jgi:uncharacterized ion transporter superfamily protein YfcC
MATAPSNSSKMPDAFVILFVVLLLAGGLSHVVPAGSFTQIAQVQSTAEGTVTRTVLDPDSFAFASESHSGVPLFASGGEVGLFNFAFEGLVSGSKWGSAIGVVAFILIVGGAFGIIMQTGAINNGILRLIKRTQHLENLFLPLMFVLFSLGGAIFGMGEEAIAFCIIIVPLVVALGYNAITGVMITYVATQIGFATSWMNPFSVAIAQGLADVPLLSGQGFRMGLWALFTLVGLAFTMWYARGVKAHPETSLSHSADAYFRQQHTDIEIAPSRLDNLILIVFALGIGWVIWGVTQHAYYIPEIATQFFIIGIAIGVLAIIGRRMRANAVSQAFVQGAKDLLPAALIVGMAKGIIIVLGGDDVTSPSTLNTLLFYMSQLIADTGAYANAIIMLLFQTGFNFFVASGSGQAAITMPLMAPLADLVGLSRQIAVLAFQLGDGFSNIIIPTSASLIGCLGVARIDWAIWVRFVWRFFVVILLLAIAVMVTAVAIGFN